MSQNPSEVWDQRFVPNNPFNATTVQHLHVGSLQDISTKSSILPMRIDGLITRERRIYISHKIPSCYATKSVMENL